MCSLFYLLFDPGDAKHGSWIAQPKDMQGGIIVSMVE